ncbi:MAG TPA: hypothetical protein VFV88_03950 [Steroidobacteraceae bacterium]|jgi:hypothetical protein|nr:hypothetical protein [Steroidobacteraceae bacterium]
MAIGKRREFEVFTLSFLDCICCGFGAIILLLVLTDVGQPIVIERSEKDLKGQIDALQRQLFDLRGETEILNRELQGRVKEKDAEQQKASILAGDLSKIRGEFKASIGDAAVANKVEQELVAVYQTLTAEQARLLKNAPKKIDTVPAVGGIPVDSEWIIFVIDTSGSMQADNWENAQMVMKEILDIYPKVKGMQVLDDEGKPLFPSTKGQWLQDTPAQRAKVLSAMVNWKAYSNSSPVEGIGAAVQGWWAADKKISVYVIGDDFTGGSIEAALSAVRKYNPVDRQGRHRIRIHAIGMPDGPNSPPFINSRFAALMRAMCDDNEGTFVGLTVGGPNCAIKIDVLGTPRCVS